MKILFLGNVDNVNLRLCIWARKLGYDATIYRMEEVGRGLPELYAPEVVKQNPDWFVSKEIRRMQVIPKTIFSSKFSREIEKKFDIVIVSGLRALLCSTKVHLPKVLFTIGYEVHNLSPKSAYYPRLNYLFSKPKRFFFYKLCNFLNKRALLNLTSIIDSFEFNFHLYDAFKIKQKVYPISLGEDCKKVRSKINESLLDSLKQKYDDYDYVFLWLSRLHFSDPNDPTYKGPELFLKSLENFIPYFKDKKVKVIIGKHGYEAQKFIKLAQKSPIYPYIDWVEHLAYADLLAYLNMPNSILFTSLGKVNKIISGISRDAMVCGTILINSATDEAMLRQFGAVIPRMYADDVFSLTKVIQDILSWDELTMAMQQQKISESANKYLHYTNYMPRFFDVISKTLKNDSKGSLAEQENDTTELVKI